MVLGSKIGKHLQLCGWAHYHVTRKKISSTERSWSNLLNALQEAIHYSLYKILHLLFFPLVQILCALHGFDAGPLEFHFFS
jgi:hypothetical protein